MQWIRGYTPQPEVDKLYRTAMGITIGGNIILAVSKALAAYYSHSIALYADTANSISDVIYSFLMVAGLYMATRPPDLSHPQGHGRFEPLAGLIVAVSMSYAGFEAGRASIMRFLQGGEVVQPGLPTLVLIFSAVVKSGMFMVINRIAVRVGSPALRASSRDNISDVLTSAAAFLGVLGTRFIHPLTDPIAGLLVSAWIFRQAYRAGRENLEFLTGKGAEEITRRQIKQMAEQVPGVLSVHHIMTEYAGPKLVVDMHINVNGATSLNETHAIEDAVIQKIQSLPDVDRAYVHIEPHDWKD